MFLWEFFHWSILRQRKLSGFENSPDERRSVETTLYLNRFSLNVFNADWWKHAVMDITLYWSKKQIRNEPSDQSSNQKFRADHAHFTSVSCSSAVSLPLWGNPCCSDEKWHVYVWSFVYLSVALSIDSFTNQFI